MFNGDCVVSVGADSRAKYNWIEIPYKVQFPDCPEVYPVKVKHFCPLESLKGKQSGGYRYDVVLTMDENGKVLEKLFHLIWIPSDDTWYCEELYHENDSTC